MKDVLTVDCQLHRANEEDASVKGFDGSFTRSPTDSVSVPGLRFKVEIRYPYGRAGFKV